MCISITFAALLSVSVFAAVITISVSSVASDAVATSAVVRHLLM
jgi:hypothetical protein